MSATARAVSVQSHKLGTPSGTPTWVTGAQVLESSHSASKDVLAGNRIGNKNGIPSQALGHGMWALQEVAVFRASGCPPKADGFVSTLPGG